MCGAILNIPPYVFKAWYFFKHRVNFTFYTISRNVFREPVKTRHGSAEHGLGISDLKRLSSSTRIILSSEKTRNGSQG
jgi:hypothetical protein